MNFSETTNKTGLIQECEFLSGIGDTQISGNTSNLKLFTRLINSRYHLLTTTIFKAMDEWDFDDPNHANTGFEKTYNLTGSQRYVELPVSDKILKVKRVEVSYDGVNWKRANPVDVNEISDAVSSSTIDGKFSTSTPFYDLIGKYLYLYPMPTASVTGGLKVWIAREIDEFATTDTTQEPGFDEPFHRMLAIGAALDWAIAKGKENKNDLAALWNDYEARLINYYGKKNADRQYILSGQSVNYD